MRWHLKLIQPRPCGESLVTAWNQSAVPILIGSCYWSSYNIKTYSSIFTSKHYYYKSTWVYVQNMKAFTIYISLVYWTLHFQSTAAASSAEQELIPSNEHASWGATWSQKKLLHCTNKVMKDRLNVLLLTRVNLTLKWPISLIH